MQSACGLRGIKQLYGLVEVTQQPKNKKKQQIEIYNCIVFAIFLVFQVYKEKHASY